MTSGRAKKWILGIAGLAVIAAGVFLALFLAGNGEKPPELAVVRPVKTMVLQAEVGVRVYSFPGKVKASEEVNLSFEIGGRLIKLPIKEGQEVSQGQLLAQLDKRNFKNRFDAAKARAGAAKAYFDRVKVAHSKGAATPMELDEARAKYEVTVAERKIAAKSLADTEMIAPFSGVVARTFVKNFRDVVAKLPILSLQDVSHIDVVVEVPEAGVMKVRRGMVAKAVALFEPLPGREFPLTVKEYATEADRQTQTYSVTFTMPAPKDVNILPGMTATAKIYIKPEADPQTLPFTVPVTAIFSDEGSNRYVWVVALESMTVHKRPVKLGHLAGSSIRVLEGLKNGEIIATAGVHYLREGMKVRRLEDETRGESR